LVRNLTRLEKTGVGDRRLLAIAKFDIVKNELYSIDAAQML
jgi:hypothetical protein